MGATMTSKRTFMLLSLLLLLTFASAKGRGRGQGQGRGQGVPEVPRVGFYARTCPNVETIVRAAVEKHFNINPAIAPGLVRMHFHDCFSHGCDASVLIDGPGTEKTAIPNLTLRGFEAIDEAKAELETACPGVVSCADILTLAARDSTNGPSWDVPLGRRDGRISQASAASNLPGPRDSIEVQKQKLATMNLGTKDLVTLVGAHTIGTTSCNLIRFRLFNFNSTGSPDPTIDPTFLPQLRAICPENGDGSVRVGLDSGSVDKFDTNFFHNLKRGRGVLQSDQFLWTDRTTRMFAQRLFGRGLFNREFGPAMVRMSNTKVLTGTEGEIRKVCNAFN